MVSQHFNKEMPLEVKVILNTPIIKRPSYKLTISESNNNNGYLNLYMSKYKSYIGCIYINELNFKIKNHNILNHIKDKISFNIFINRININ